VKKKIHKAEKDACRAFPLPQGDGLPAMRRPDEGDRLYRTSARRRNIISCPVVTRRKGIIASHLAADRNVCPPNLDSVFCYDS
jgi:hypothetical protein